MILIKNFSVIVIIINIIIIIIIVITTLSLSMPIGASTNIFSKNHISNHDERLIDNRYQFRHKLEEIVCVNILKEVKDLCTTCYYNAVMSLNLMF